jgi:hypothetical protein
MNFDDTARYNGPTVLFPCLMCEVLMVWGPAMQVTNGRLVRRRDKNGRVLEQWDCPRCGFFYTPLIPRTVPKKYQEKLADTGVESAQKWCARVWQSAGFREAEILRQMCPFPPPKSKTGKCTGKTAT